MRKHRRHRVQQVGTCHRHREVGKLYTWPAPSDATAFKVMILSKKVSGHKKCFHEKFYGNFS
jgi:hypothetical protein